MTSTSAKPHMPRMLACVLAAALVPVSLQAPAQSVVHPTPAERARHQAHAQQLESRQQSRKLHQRLQKQINDTASKAYKGHPDLQRQMRHAGGLRQRQAQADDADLQKRIDRDRRPLPVHAEPAPAGSR